MTLVRITTSVTQKYQVVRVSPVTAITILIFLVLVIVMLALESVNSVSSTPMVFTVNAVVLDFMVMLSTNSAEVRILSLF